MKATDIERFLTMCLSLASEQDREALLSSILDTAMDICRCDAGTLYLLEDDGLHFCRMVTRSLHVRQGGHGDPITLPPVPMEPKYVCSWAALSRQSINVADVRTDDRFDFTGSIRYDAMTGYRTQSMLVVPMSNEKGELIGVTQLINALDADGNTIPFDPELELLVSAISSQAAISATNMLYNEQIVDLLNSLVQTLSTAIDERSHYNANHTRNMVRYAGAFLDYLDRIGHPWRFDDDKRRAFLMSVWLHDVGKLAVPLEVMDKETRLGPGIERVRQRFRLMALLNRLDFLEGRISEAAYQENIREREKAVEMVEGINRAGFLSDDGAARMNALAARTFTDENGEAVPWITEQERQCLTIRRGTLTDAERAVMQGHASVTRRILSHVSFPKSYAQVPAWASAHHELLNGKGYPDHLTARDIPSEVRLLTILDIFEALTALDRPYKPPMIPDRALGVLHSMVDEGALDEDLVALFEESRAWEAKYETA